MKKAIALFLAAIMLFSLVACGGGGNASDGYEIALVTDVGNIDDKSFNEGSWNGVKEFAEKNKKTYAYYRPSEDSTEARVESIGQAVEKGAKAVVCPGFMFAETLDIVQAQYPDVMFLGLDISEGDMNSISPNVALITYQEEQSGYLAGYASVMDGFTKLGFLGGFDVPAVVRFGYGFVQGANDAAAVKNVDVDINYWYGQAFWPTDDAKIKMDSWYTGGTEIVFACGGGILASAQAAAEESTTGKLIGVDVDQANISPLILTSAVKGLTESTVIALEKLYANKGTWPSEYSGKGTVLGAADNSVGLPKGDSWRFENYTEAEYNELFKKVASGEIKISDSFTERPNVSINVDYQD
ncbi:BMP family ABC transporter substrate-binding protein [Clostridiaceae bacterium OttesenSCG-928-D20]|nr:BMP family ABC transporter substrate-binding protein [Clostridiaceae bacterium OttesenSCG-928-D20]